MLTTLLIYGLVGAIVGILAGLFGIGGGLVIVPMLIYAFSLQNIPHELTMHLALGTSLASIIFTSISSFLAHHKRGAVHWDIVKKIVIGILTGTFLGSCIASLMSTNFLKIFFVIFLYFVATQLLLNKKPKPGREIPGNLGMFATGNIIGVFSSLVGIGGGTLSVPFMLWCNINAHHAIGTSAAIGLPIALAGAIGYIFNGWNVANLPAYSLGYVYLPALFGIAAVSILTAPLGVRLAHSLPVDKLKRIFSLLLYVVATKMLVSAL
ncbi:sulfite exporter TauE/SafE family protein [Desulforhopalus sp. IMCC35007]|uniref:sulfite exporter TauE/SafE family protein n=1 Tax=Desulforhopalus sp. IMCC35007 TaxID=2569543 RepID=UPI0010ADC7E9|nr:sulfite exporter TauE/SafE family protein [Desulforhopalus sp. IMCC35007]TKB12098.1 sulfite exporter TauE/SafE family protein [Desulforhopalus sp. IMCC35007]